MHKSTPLPTLNRLVNLDRLGRGVLCLRADCNLFSETGILKLHIEYLHISSPRVCLKTDNMPNGEGFFWLASGINQRNHQNRS